MASTKTKSKAKKKSASKTASGEMSASKRKKLPAADYAFPKERKEPLNDAKHVRNAVARFDQVQGVSDGERDAAWKRIKRAAKKFGVNVSEKSWRALGRANGKSKGKSHGSKPGSNSGKSRGASKG